MRPGPGPDTFPSMDGPDVDPALLGLTAVSGLMTLLWLGSLPRKDASLVDRFWGLAFVLLAWLYVLLQGSRGTERWILPVLATIWGLRLSLYLTWRNWGHGEDRRYDAMRARHGGRFGWRSLFTVFLLQGLLAWVLATPFLVFVRSEGIPNPGVLGTGVMCWVFGIVFEAGADWQLARHRSRSENRGSVLDTGFWHYTRHPNYFGDALVWVGYWLLAASVGGWWTVFSPVLMTFLLVRVSGVRLLEQSLLHTKPSYASYAARTSAFFPWLRRKSGQASR